MLLAEEIMQTFVSVLDAALAANLYRGPTDRIPDARLPAVAVYQGAEEPAGDRGRANLGVMDQYLEVRTEVADAASAANLETKLNELRRQVHQVLMAENALGLAYVIDIIPAGVEEPEVDGSTERYVGSMVLNWLVHYRHNVYDAGVAP